MSTDQPKNDADNWAETQGLNGINDYSFFLGMIAECGSLAPFALRLRTALDSHGYSIWENTVGVASWLTCAYDYDGRDRYPYHGRWCIGRVRERNVLGNVVGEPPEWRIQNKLSQRY